MGPPDPPANGSRTQASGLASGKRLLWLVVAALLLGAGALWGSSKLTWIEVPAGRTIDGRLAGDLSGADLNDWHLPLAVFAVAAIAAALASHGMARRVLGAVVLAGGLWALYLTLSGGADDVAWSGTAPGYEDVPGDPVRTVFGPAAAVAGAVLLAAAGGLLLWRGRGMPRLGSRYSAPGARKAAADPDQDLWKALSEGDDPTSRS